MEIVIGKSAGFCFGVANAVNKTNDLLNTSEKSYCLGELVHNNQVTDELQKKGLVIIDNVEQAKNNIIIRSHGVKKQIYKKAEKLRLHVTDLTCPKVIKIHNIATEYSNNGYYIFLIGQKDHPETIATISYCGKNATIIEKQEDINKGLEKFYNSNIKKLLILSQTTYSLEKFDSIVSFIKEIIQENAELEVKNTICDATRLRQEETKKIASKVDMMIIIGGKHSSNTNKLYNISTKYCKNCILIETKDELSLDYIKQFEKIGIMAGASTPQKSIET
ncbi:MAG: 4-hydroxy-3-methylbut-2-enyl diphosphate reductase, partial [Clostridia bacterium]|nr:4-hydroxy-3-methylbut-2-enyl diphosphate reductase [Clostridia bacterium]